MQCLKSVIVQRAPVVFASDYSYSSFVRERSNQLLVLREKCFEIASLFSRRVPFSSLRELDKQSPLVD